MARKKNIAAGQNAVIYARYSSHNQREVSIEQQVRECMKHAAELGLHVVGTYEDRAISGKTDKRPNFQRMMRDAEKGKFQAVVAWKSNRIGRNMLQAMVNEAKLEDCGVKVFYAEEDFDDTAAGRFALRNMMNVNQFYSENMAEDITRGLYDNASKCMANGRQPLGYKRGEDGRVVLDEANAAVVREIFTRVAAGDLFVDIARDLNAQGIKTSKGANWNKGSFQSICQNERYRGIYIYGDVRVADGIPRIVSDDLWYRVQEAMRMKKNPVGTRHRVGAEDYLLTGKLRCGHCGSYMTGVSGTSRNGELHYYYTCQKRRTEHACDKKNIRRDVIEPAVAQAIKMYCLTDDVIAWIADRTVEYWEKHDNDLQIEALEQQLEENKKATSNMLKAIEMGIITEATRTRMVELETEQSRLSVQLNVAKEDVVKIDREQIISYLELLQQGDIHDRDFQMELFKNFLVAVYVYDDNRMKLVFSCMGDQNSVEIPLETGEDPPDGGLSPDAKMFVLTPDSSTRSERHHTLCGAFFVLHCSRKTQKNFCPLPQPARNGLFCARMADHGRQNLCYNIKNREAEGTGGAAMNLQTAIVEDSKPDAERLKQLLKKAFENENISCSCFASGDEFLRAGWREGYQVVFLDICMEGTNGIETAQRLRAADPDLLIVFVTSSPEYVWDAFPVHPFDYLLKPYKEEKFEQLAGELRRVLCRQQPELEVRIARQIVRLPLTKIYYATAQNHYVRVVTDDGECRATANFAQVQEQLQTQPEFLVCNRGVIINMSKVLRFEGDCIEMLDGTHLPVRQKDKNSLLAQFTQYQFRGMQREF